MVFSTSLVDIIKRRESRVVVLTGAGISAESGLATFRDQDGLWQKFKPEELANFEAFYQNPKLVLEFYAMRREITLKARPNPAHLALAKMEKYYDTFTLVTQNIDNLHTAAGNSDVLELHGNLTRSLCSQCRSPSEKSFSKAVKSFEELPRCDHCQSLLRPDVVWFGEALPEGLYERAVEETRTADLFLSIGTSAEVFPAANLPIIARQSGAYVVEINPNRTSMSVHFHEFIEEKAGPALLELTTHLE
jgi:NAD-dependent deacetylase